MKILIDARMYGIEYTGIGRYTVNLIFELAKLDSKNNYVILLRKKYYDTLKLPSNFQKVLCDLSHYSLKEQLHLTKIINSYHPDLVHFLHFNVPLSYRGKFIVTIHDMTMHKQKPNSSNLFLPLYMAKHFAYKKVFKHAVVSAQTVIVPTEYVKREILTYFKLDSTKVKVTYEGIRNNLYIKNLTQPESKNIIGQVKSPYFLYVGNLYPHKNLSRAIQAIIDLNKEDKKVNLYLVCSRSIFTKRLEREVSKLGAQDSIKFLGYVDDENLIKLHEKSVGFIYPSLAEGFGLPGLEALQAGTLLVASKIPVFREVYGHHAIYFDPLNIESIKSALEKAMFLPKYEAEKIIRDNKEFVKRYSWSQMAKETLAVYNSLK